jgi:integral membrane protein (TIGR01906 family)
MRPSSTAGTQASAVAARVNAAPEALDWVRGLVSVAFVVLLPLLIIGTSLRGLVTDRDFMLRGFREYNVAATTGLDDPQLQRIADAFVAYFQAPPGQIQMQVTAFGQPRLLFNEREVAHMEDVQALIQFFLRMQLVAAAVVSVRLLVALFLERGVVDLGRDMLLSTALMVALVVVVGIASAIDFDALWTHFHQIAFRNDLWLLDPTRDYLIMLFPEPFWFAATIRMATSVAVQTLVVALLGAGFFLSPRLFAGRS